MLGLVLGEADGLASLGVALGLLGALALSGVVAKLPFAVRPTDPLTLAGVSVVVALAVALAAWLPARRAANVDPARTLRSA